jgi:hypothetical protein
MYKSNTNHTIQGKATFKKDINKKLIRSEQIRARLDQNYWWISNRSIILVNKDYQRYDWKQVFEHMS